MTVVENSTRPPPLQKWFKTGLLCKYCPQSSFNVVLYNCIVLYPTYAEREGALSSSIVLHSCLPDAYINKDIKYKFHIKELFP
jgi:hypothetical protein